MNINYNHPTTLRTHNDNRRFGNNDGKNELARLGGSSAKRGWYIPASVSMLFLDMNSLDTASRTISTYDGEIVSLEFKTTYSSYERTLDKKEFGRLSIKVMD